MSLDPSVDWEAERQRGAKVRAFEVWSASPEGLRAWGPFERIRKLEAGNAKLQRKIETRRARIEGR